MCREGKTHKNQRYLNFQNKFNFDGIDFSTSLMKIRRCKKNNNGANVNKYGLNSNEKVYPTGPTWDEAFENASDDVF